jgi:hypothetical protein
VRFDKAASGGRKPIGNGQSTPIGVSSAWFPPALDESESRQAAESPKELRLKLAKALFDEVLAKR